MEVLGKLSREVQLILAAAVLYLVFSFFDWQQVSTPFGTAGISEWHGVGVIAGLLLFALIIWELARAFVGDIDLGPLTAGLISIALALLLLLFTVITFLTHNEFRHWPSWLGLILSIVIAVLAFGRARNEGVQMPDLSAMQARTQGGTTRTTTPPPAATDAPPPVETPPPSAPSGDAPAGP